MSRRHWRRLRMGLETVTGWRARGFFSPYRYADRIGAPVPYAALEAAFGAARPDFATVLGAIETHGETLAAFDGPPPEPRWGQSWFPRLDGAAAYAIVRGHAPARIVEVGSGHSTRMLARAAKDAEAGTRITCIDPAPRAAFKGLTIDWQQRVLSAQDVPLFETLAAGDIAFFDSSHLLWPGSDVDMILNRILPVLAPGVLVHIHDILLPDPYPEDWGWRGYTEQLGLLGWILGGAYRPVFSSHYAITRMGAAGRGVPARLPLPEGARETSLWLRRV